MNAKTIQTFGIINIILSIFVVAYYILFTFPQNSISTIFGAIWEFAALPITIWAIVSILLVTIGIIMHRIKSFSFFTGSVALLVLVFFGLPYII